MEVVRHAAPGAQSTTSHVLPGAPCYDAPGNRPGARVNAPRRGRWNPYPILYPGGGGANRSEEVALDDQARSSRNLGYGLASDPVRNTSDGGARGSRRLLRLLWRFTVGHRRQLDHEFRTFDNDLDECPGQCACLPPTGGAGRIRTGSPAGRPDSPSTCPDDDRSSSSTRYDGPSSRIRPTGSLDRAAVQLNPKVASVTRQPGSLSCDCRFDSSELVYAATGKPVPPVTPPQKIAIQVQPDRGLLWRVEGADQHVTEGILPFRLLISARIRARCQSSFGRRRRSRATTVEPEHDLC